MKIAELRKLINAGLSDTQIMSLVNDEKPAQEEKKEEKKDFDFSELVTAVNELKETLQASNIRDAKGKEPETVDEILESLLIED